MWLKKTEELIDILSTKPSIKNYVLVGGSALSYWLKHRYSEDIDLFTGDNILKLRQIDNLIMDIRDKYKVDLVLEEDSIQRDYLINGVKVTFCSSNFDFLRKKENKILYKNNFYIAKKEILYAMKAYTIGRRCKLRDYYDLMLIIKNIGLKKLIDITKDYYNGLFNKKLFLTQLADIDNIKEDYLPAHLINNKISKKEISIFLDTVINTYIKEYDNNNCKSKKDIESDLDNSSQNDSDMQL